MNPIRLNVYKLLEQNTEVILEESAGYMISSYTEIQLPINFNYPYRVSTDLVETD